MFKLLHIKIWDLKIGSCLETLEAHKRGVYSLCLLPSGELISGSCDNTIKIWKDLTKQQLVGRDDDRLLCDKEYEINPRRPRSRLGGA